MSVNLWGWPKKLVGNIKLKILALGLAVFVWYLVQGAISFEIDVRDVPVKVLLNDELSLASLAEEQVIVRFHGAQEDLLRVGRDNVELVADLRKQHAEGLVLYEIKNSDVRAPEGAMVRYVRPAVLHIQLKKQSN